MGWGFGVGRWISLFVKWHVARQVETYIAARSDGVGGNASPFFDGDAFSAYPEETIDYLVTTIDPENPLRCLLTQEVFGRVFFGNSVCTLYADWSKYPERLIRYCETLTVERFDESDSPEERRRKCREFKEWWDRY